MGSPYRTGVDLDGSINWHALAKEIADIPGGVAVLRLLQVHNIDRLVNLKSTAQSSIDYLIDIVHESLR